MAEGNNDRVGFVKENTAAAVFKKYPGKYGSEASYQLLCPNNSKAGLSIIMITNVMTMYAQYYF